MAHDLSTLKIGRMKVAKISTKHKNTSQLENYTETNYMSDQLFPKKVMSMAKIRTWSFLGYTVNRNFRRE